MEEARVHKENGVVKEGARERGAEEARGSVDGVKMQRHMQLGERVLPQM